MKPEFWTKLKIVLIVLFILFIIAGAGCLIALEGWRRLFFTSCAGVLAVNVLLAYIFVRVNDRRRPSR